MGIEGRADTTTRIREPLDGHEQWEPIYEAIVRMIGEPAAWSWFAHVRFIALTDSTLTLSHWGSFPAQECIRRYGEAIAKAAHVHTVKINRTGGFVPDSHKQKPQKRPGFEIYQRPTVEKRT